MKREDISKKRPMSDTTLKALEPEAKEYRERDVDNLYFRVKPNRNKSWQLRYKKPDGKWSWVGIGAYPAVSGELARKIAQELNKALSKGENPIITKQEKKQQELEATSSTFEKLAVEWLDGKVNKWTEGTMKRNKGALEKHIFPVMGKRAYVSFRFILH